MVKAILFDLGDTLFDLAPVNKTDMFRAGARRTYEYLRVRGHSLPPFPRYFRTTFAMVLWNYFREKIRGREFQSLPAIARRCKQLNIHPDKLMLDELGWEAYAPQVGYTVLEEDLIQTLDLFQRRGLKLGIVSNTFVPAAALDRHLRMVGLYSYFPVRIYSGEFGHRKPGQRIFKHALEQIGTAAHETVFVGDRIETDMIGARRAGMTTVLKRPAGMGRPHRCVDHVIQRIAELPNVLAQLRTTAPDEAAEIMEASELQRA